MGMKEELTKEYGVESMKKPPSRDELYDAVDIITEAIRSHRKRLDALDGQKAMKPRYRVPAETRSY